MATIDRVHKLEESAGRNLLKGHVTRGRCIDDTAPVTFRRALNASFKFRQKKNGMLAAQSHRLSGLVGNAASIYTVNSKVIKQQNI